MGLFKKLRDFGKRVVGGIRTVAQHVAPIVQKAMPIVESIAPMFGPKGAALAGGLRFGSNLLSNIGSGNREGVKDNLRTGFNTLRSRINSPRIGLRGGT